MVRSVLRCRRRELADILGLEIRVALELVPRVVERELRDLVDLVAALEQPAGGLVAQIVKAKVLDAQDMARAGEGGPDASWLVGKDAVSYTHLDVYKRQAMAQGPTRRARGEAFVKYLDEHLGATNSRALIVPECGHNDRCVFTTDAVLAVLFPAQGK